MRPRHLQCLQILAMHSPCKAEKLAEALGISTRTLRSDIASINALIGVALIETKYCHGYVLTERGRKVYEEFKEQSGDTASEDVALAIYGELLRSSERRMPVEVLEEMYWVSASGVRRAVEELNQRSGADLLSYRLNAVELCGDGIWARWQAIRRLRDDVIASLDPSMAQYRTFFGEAWNASYWEGLCSSIKNLLEAQNCYLHPDQHLLLSASIYLFQLLGKSVKNLSGGGTTSSLTTPFVLELMQLEGVILDAQDLEVLTDLLQLFHSEANCRPSMTAKRLYEAFCALVEARYGIDFQSDTALSQHLSQHIENMWHRILHGFFLKNAWKQSIKRRYPYAYSIASLIVPLIHAQQKILPDDELAFLALYVEYFLAKQPKQIIVGIDEERPAFRYLLAQWVMQHFETRIRLLPSDQERQYPEKVELWLYGGVSSRMRHNEQAFFFGLSGLPEKDDIKRFDECLREVETYRMLQKWLPQIFAASCIHIYERPIDWEDLVAEAAQQFFCRGSIEDPQAYKEEILWREEQYPSSLRPEVRIPHPLTQEALKDDVQVILLKHPVLRRVRLFFFLALKPARSEWKDALFEYFRLLAADEKWSTKLLEVQEESTLFEILQKPPHWRARES